MMFVIDREGVFRDYYAPDPEKLLSPPDAFIGRIITEILPPSLAEITGRNIRKTLQTGELQVYEYSLDMAGSRRFFEARMVKSGDDEVLTIVREVTTQKASEREKATRDRIKSVLLTTSDMEIYNAVLEVLLDVFDSSVGNFGYIDDVGNLVCPSMLGDVWEQCDLPDKSMVFSPESWGDTTWGVALRTGRSSLKNEAFSVPEGHIPISRSMVAPVVHQDEVLGIIHLANRDRDYGADDLELLESLASFIAPVLKARLERARARRELENSEKRFRDVTFSMADIVWETGPDDVYTYCSSQVEKILGYKPEELVGRKTPFDLMPPEEAERLRKLQDETVLEKGVARDVENLNRAKDGRDVWLMTNALPIMDAAGNMVGVRGVDKDITEKKRLEEEALRAQKLESLGVLAGGLAHDFNNILTSVMGNISLARSMGHLSEDAQERLSEAETALVRAKDLTFQLLTFAKGGAPVRRPSSITDIIRDSVEFALTGSNVKFEMEATGDLWTADVDPGQFSQVIQNLVINADQSMPGGGAIRIGARNIEVGGGDTAHAVEPGRYVCVTISDDGMGIPKEHLDRIFDPYFTTKQKGSGLGLAVTHSVIVNHGGHISVRSELGRGTSFEVLIPATDGLPEQSSADETAIEAGSGRILVMDDEEMVRDVAAALLEHSGFEVECVADGAQAIEVYSRARDSGSPFDAVILDLTVPGGMGGKEAIAHLKKMDPDVRAVVSSGYSNDPIMSEYSRHGFKGVAAKPYRPAELTRTIRRAIDGRADNPSG